MEIDFGGAVTSASVDNAFRGVYTRSAVRFDLELTTASSPER